jgi:hypothetical protein
MSTPNPALVAAAPILAQGLTLVKTAVTTILTGDPALLPARIQPALAILDAQLVLLAPALLTAEEAVGAAEATSGLDGLIAKLNAIAATPPAAK